MRTSASIAAFLGLACALSAAAIEPVALPTLDRIYLNPVPAAVADFALTDQRGKKRNFSSFRGDPVLVFFGFTHCPKICPATLTRLKTLHETRDGSLKSAQVVLISVDGERDTPVALKSFLAPLSPDFVGLTGNPKESAEHRRRLLRRILQGAARQGRQLQRHALLAGLRRRQGGTPARLVCQCLGRGHGDDHRAPD